MNNNNYKSLLNEYEIFSNSINNIFKTTNDDNSKLLIKNNIKTRNNKINFSDVLLYKFLYTFKNNTKQHITSLFNYNNNLSIDRTTYHKKDLIMSTTFYKNLFYKVAHFYNDNFKIKNQINLVAVDGTYNNTNIHNIKGNLETSLNMGFYNINECIPIDITFCNQENKNKEILQLKKYIINKNFKHLNNIVLVLDRAYYSFDLINFLDAHNFNYVIRIKNNCTLIKNKDLIKNKIDKHNNIRIITYKDSINLIKKNKEGNNVNLNQIIECNIITNLDKSKYNDEEIKKIYLSRWDIEVFFKFLKSNFKFSKLIEHNKKNTINEYNKLYYSILIIIYITTMIDKINDKYNKIISKKENKKKKNNYNVKTNKSLLVNGIQLILKQIVKGVLNKNDLLNISKSFLLKVNIIKDISNQRISKTPHTKWYIQSYAEHYRYLKIIEAIEKKDMTVLNKNLKLLASTIKIAES